jgi:hypothetical protein
MPAPESTKERLQVDWLISNLRWLLLVSVALVSFTEAFINHGGFFDAAFLLPQIILLAGAALYNLVVMLLLLSGALKRVMPVMTLLIDTLLVVGFVVLPVTSSHHLRLYPGRPCFRMGSAPWCSC